MLNSQISVSISQKIKLTGQNVPTRVILLFIPILWKYTYTIKPSLSSGQTRKHCSGNIMFPTNVSPFPRKQKCFPTNSETFLLRKQCFLVCPHVFKCFQHEKHYTWLALWKHHVNLLLQSFRSVKSDLHQC